MSSIEKRDGSFRVKFRQDGRQRSLTFATEKGAIAWRKQLDALGPAAAIALLNAPQKTSMRLSDLLHSHIETLTGVTTGTRHSYKGYIEHHMGDIIDLPLSSIDRTVVAGWVNSLAAKGLSGKSIANVHGFLSAALNVAVEDELIAKNPCRGMRLPRTDENADEMVFLTPEEFARLYDLIPAHYQPFVLTLVSTGIRFGEASALTVADLNVANKSLRIRQAWKKSAPGQRDLGAPKTKRGNRTVAVPEQVVEVLAEIAKGKAAKEYLFTNTKGAPLKNNSFWQRVWSPMLHEFAGDTVTQERDQWGHVETKVLKEGRGKRPKIHDLRHTFASWAIQNGVPLPVIQRQLGHESITTTVDRYGHIARADFDALARVTGSLLPDRLAIEG